MASHIADGDSEAGCHALLKTEYPGPLKKRKCMVGSDRGDRGGVERKAADRSPSRRKGESKGASDTASTETENETDAELVGCAPGPGAGPGAGPGPGAGLGAGEPGGPSTTIDLGLNVPGVKRLQSFEYLDVTRLSEDGQQAALPPFTAPFVVVEYLKPTLFGRLSLARQPDGSTVVVKEFYKEQMLKGRTKDGDYAVAENGKNEIHVHWHISQDPHCPKYIVRVKQLVETDRRFHMVMEQCALGDAFKNIDLLRVRPRFFSKQLLAAVYYLHSLGIAHRDLSLENLLLSDKDTIKLCDFGNALNVGLNGEQVRNGPQIPGKLVTMAPEVYARDVHCPLKADMWSLGVIIFMLHAGKPLFEEPSMQSDVCKCILDGHLKYVVDDFRKKEEFNMSDDAIDLVQGLLRRPNERLTWQHLLQHRWLN